MKIQIIHRACGGTEFLPQPSRLHLGAQNAEGVDRLQFQLPESWANCAIALYLRRSDGTQLAPVPLDGDACVTVDRRLTGCTGGQWMLAAVSGSGYTAYTRPGRYDTYATLPTDGGSEDLPPTLYEQFVARVLESASTAATAAQSASASAERCTSSAAQAQTAARQASTSSTAAAGCASRAEAAAARAEELAPADGQVLSVNGKSGVVVLRAQDVGALPRPAQPAAGSLLRVLSVNPDTGALLTDTTPPPDLTPYVRSSTLPDAKTPGPVRIDPQYGVAVREDATLTLVPASAEQLDSMTDGFAPLTPALLPYGVKKALTTASTAAGWTGAEKTAALRTLGADLTVLWQGIGTSLALSAVTVVIMLVLLVPTMVIVHIRSKVLERAIEWVATLPLTIPAIVLVVGLGPIYRWLSADVLSTNPIWLCFAYVILVMPFAFRAIAVGLNSIDVKTLVEASRSLGASWPKVFFKVIIPNLWQSILSASFISIAVVLGEYTVASLLGRMNLQVALYQLGQSNSQISTAMSLLALLFGAVLLVALDLISDAMRKSREGK